VGIVGVAAMMTWVFQNRETLAAACLRTVDGISSKIAHLNEPFGVGTAVQPKNPIVGVVPDFSLTDSSGRNIHKSDLLGGYWIASFIFTRCATSCPRAVNELTKLQEDLPDDVTLVSFSVDPDYDSPEVLAEYAKAHGADVDRWLFLTGEKNSLYKDIREGFRLTVEGNEDAPPGWGVTHTPRFALVDEKGRIRGYYGSSEPEDMIRLRKDVARLLKKDPEHG
jgi:protein SCO1/2